MPHAQGPLPPLARSPFSLRATTLDRACHLFRLNAARPRTSSTAGAVPLLPAGRRQGLVVFGRIYERTKRSLPRARGRCPEGAEEVHGLAGINATRLQASASGVAPRTGKVPRRGGRGPWPCGHQRDSTASISERRSLAHGKGAPKGKNRSIHGLALSQALRFLAGSRKVAPAQMAASSTSRPMTAVMP